MDYDGTGSVALSSERERERERERALGGLIPLKGSLRDV